MVFSTMLVPTQFIPICIMFSWNHAIVFITRSIILCAPSLLLSYNNIVGLLCEFVSDHIHIFLALHEMLQQQQQRKTGETNIFIGQTTQHPNE